jgi:hypothetical protein
MAEYEQMLGASRLGAPGLYQTFDRRLCSGTRTLTSQTMDMSAIFLPAGLTVTNIVLFSVGGVTTNSHNWAALYTNNLVLMAQSTDDTTSTDFAANTKITKALTAAQTTTYSGLYYIGWMQQASTPNTMLSSPAITASAIMGTDAPILAGTSTGSLGASAPAAAAALTNAGTIQQLYAYVT